MKTDIVKTLKSIWKPGISDTTNKEISKFDIEEQKKLLQIFSIGDSYWYIFNIHSLTFDYMSPEMESILGYSPAELTVPFLINSFHPDDYPTYFNFENKVIEFLETLTPQQKLNYKFRYDYRIKKKDGTFMRIMQQSLAIELDENNKLSKVLGVHTDISHIKKVTAPMLSFIGLNGEPSYIDVDVKEIFKLKNNSHLTNREHEILEFLFEGKSSQEISTILGISRDTVDKHRTNMLAKTNSKNTAQLIAEAIKTDWFMKAG